MELVKRKTITPAVQRQSAAASYIVAVSKTSGVTIQPSLKVSSPTDSSEQEAVGVAGKVMRMQITDNSITYKNSGAAKVFRLKSDLKEEKIQRQGQGIPKVSPASSSQIQNSSSEGSALPSSVRSFIKPCFKADFSNVKVHTSQKSAGMNAQLSAKPLQLEVISFLEKISFIHSKQKEKN